jgi:hypothetical protein
MQREEKSRFIQLCEQASVERDSTRLIQLVREINDMLEKKRLRLNGSPESSGDPPNSDVGHTSVVISNDSF